jgi:hypothetical protein
MDNTKYYRIPFLFTEVLLQTKYSIQDYVNVVKQGIAKTFSSEKPTK